MALITQSDSASLISPSRGVFAAATLAELKTFTVPLVNQTVEVDGSVSRGDGLAGTYYWNATDSRADNGTTIIQSNAGGVGRWNLVAATALDSTFTPAGAGAVARSVQDALRAAIRGSDYSTAANFLAAVTSLTEAFGAATLNVGPQTGWTTFEKAAFVDTAKNFFGARNLPLLGLTQTNYSQLLGHDDNNTVANIVTTYSAMTDNHPSGTRASAVGLESDIFHTGAGTTTGEAGVIGFAQASAGVVTDQHGVQGQIANTGGTITNSAAVYGIYTQSGGAITNSYAGLFAGPNISAGTVTNNYGVYIGRVGSSGTSKNYQLYIEGSGAGNPVVVDNTGKLGVGLVTPTSLAHISGADGNVILLVAGATKAVRIGASSGGSSLEGVDSTGVGSYQQLSVGGSTTIITASGVPVGTFSGGLQIGAPTGGDKGAGTINAAAAYYANGTAGVASFGPAAVASITVKNGIITAIS